MKVFETPVVEIVMLAVQDIITTSEGEEFVPPTTGENQTPYG